MIISCLSINFSITKETIQVLCSKGHFTFVDKSTGIKNSLTTETSMVSMSMVNVFVLAGQVILIPLRWISSGWVTLV